MGGAGVSSCPVAVKQFTHIEGQLRGRSEPCCFEDKRLFLTQIESRDLDLTGLLHGQAIT